MKPFRIERLEKELLRIANNALLFKTNDPRLQQVTITDVNVSPDLQFAKFFFSVFEDETDIDQWTIVLTKASGFFKKEIAATKIMRRIPEIRFVYDDTGERVREVESAFDKINSLNKSEEEEE